MSAFKDFERKVVRILVENSMSPAQLESLLDTAHFVSLEDTGVGYFLTVRHSAVTTGRMVCGRPVVVGKAGDSECGFVVFLEDGTLTLECHSWRDDAFPENFRGQDVEVTTAPELGY